jgi:hypothetical protein
MTMKITTQMTSVGDVVVFGVNIRLHVLVTQNVKVFLHPK